MNLFYSEKQEKSSPEENLEKELFLCKFLYIKLTNTYTATCNNYDY